MDDRALVFSILAGPAHYAHKTGKEMTAMIPGGTGTHRWQRAQEKKMLRAADEHFEIIMRTFNTAQAASIVKTWLTHYQLPLDPSRLKNFDLFHAMCKDQILTNYHQIRSY
jgi:hypothetical protein